VKRFFANAALTFFALALALGAGEFAVRLLYKDSTVLFPRYHTDYQYGRYLIRGIRPNSEFWMTSVDGSWRFTTNSRGFRNTQDFSYEKTPNTSRVLSLGDSHTQGYEVRQDFTYSAVLERYLATHKGGKAEVINTGVSGFSTAEALVLLENEGFKYRPDAVVLGFFANDFEDNLKAGLFGLDDQNRLVERSFEHIPGVRLQNLIYGLPPVRWLGENSYFYSLLFNRVWDFFKARLASLAARETAKSEPGATATSPGPEYAVPTQSTFTPYQIALAAALIERMHKFCVDKGIRFFVVDIPMGAGRYRYKTSMPPELVARLVAARIEHIESRQLLGDLDGTVETNVPHGHNHISEFTHTMIGIEVGKRLMTGASAR